MDKTHEMEFASNLNNLIVDIEKLKKVPEAGYEGIKFTDQEKFDYRMLKLSDLKHRIDYIAHDLKCAHQVESV